MSAQSEIDRANDIAAMIALQELLRIVIGEMCYNDDPTAFRENLRKIEQTAVDGITNRRHFPTANDETEAHIKESASGFITRLMTTIRHPKDT